MTPISCLTCDSLGEVGHEKVKGGGLELDTQATADFTLNVISTLQHFLLKFF